MDYIKSKEISQRMCETNDCAVKAIAIACDVPYRVAHKALELQGRKKRGGSALSWIHNAIKGLGFEINAVDTTAKTITSLPRDRQHNQGYYIALVSGHVAAMVDGQVEDWSEGRRNRIKVLYKITPATTRKQRKQLMKELFA